jgi:RNA polymerase sigma-70 factor (ECF subfamily)
MIVKRARSSGSLSDSKDENELCALMRRAQSGDENSYKDLLTRIEKMLKSFVKKSVSPQSTEDVVQEIILAIHHKRHTYNSEQFFLPWLYAIARYKVVDYIRAKTRGEVLSYKPEDFERLLVADANAVVDSVSVDDLEGILLKLPEKQRQIVKSVKIDGLSIKETALKFSLSESDIKVSIHRALKTLKVLFSEGP